MNEIKDLVKSEIALNGFVILYYNDKDKKLKKFKKKAKYKLFEDGIVNTYLNIDQMFDATLRFYDRPPLIVAERLLNGKYVLYYVRENFQPLGAFPEKNEKNSRSVFVCENFKTEQIKATREDGAW